MKTTDAAELPRAAGLFFAQFIAISDFFNTL